MVKATTNTTKRASKKMQSVEIRVHNLSITADALHLNGYGWGTIASLFGISPNTLRTVRKNAQK